MLSVVDQSQTYCPFHPFQPMPIPTRLTPQTKNCRSSIPPDSTQCVWRTGHFLDLYLESVATDQSLENVATDQSSQTYCDLLSSTTSSRTLDTAIKAIVPMSTQNYSVYRPRHCFTLYIAIKRTLLSTKLTRCVDQDTVSHWT